MLSRKEVGHAGARPAPIRVAALRWAKAKEKEGLNGFHPFVKASRGLALAGQIRKEHASTRTKLAGKMNQLEQLKQNKIVAAAMQAARGG